MENPRWCELRQALFNGNGLAKRLLLAVVGFSTCITAIITARDLYLGYHNDLSDIDEAFRFVETSYAPSLSRSVWQFDDELVRSQLQGMLRLPDVERAEVVVDGQARWFAGQVSSQRQLQTQILLVHGGPGGDQTIGTLRVVAGLDRAIARVWQRLGHDLLANGIKTMLVAGFTLLVFQFLLTRHLSQVAGFVRGIDPQDPATMQRRLTLNRAAGGRWRPDILDAVAESINGLLQALQAARDRLDETLRKLADSELRMRALTAHTSALIYELDAEGRILFANREGSALGGLVVGSLAEQWLPPAHRTQFEECLRDAISNGTRGSFELEMPNGGAAPRHYKLTVAPMRAAAGAARSAVVTALEVTDIKTAQAALRDANRSLESRVRERTAALEAARDEAQRANQAKSEFLSRMSHELRTPMNAILGFAQLIEMSGVNAQTRHRSGEIRQAGEHLLQLIDELLDLARIEVGRLNVRLEPVELQPVIEEAASLCRVSLRDHQVAVDVASTAPPVWVHVDRVRLRQILVNLLSNAIKYNREGGGVTVRYRLLGGRRVWLEVTDTGLGIAREQMVKLFMPFERLGREEASVGGTGIGLALSKRLAELMHIELGAESTAGEGSTFWLDMPLAEPAVRGSMHLGEGALRPRGHQPTVRVLYVEDNRANLALMEEFFHELPHLTLLSATDGLRGIAVAKAELPDLVLLDIQLPQMDGYAVLQALKGDPATRDIPVVAVTADAMPHDIKRGEAAGFSAYLVKPIRLDDVARVVEELVRHHRGARGPGA